MGYVEELRALVGHQPLILTGAVAILVNENGEILLQERTSPKRTWGLPGGLMELGESTEETAKREVYEETNLRIEQLKLINIFSGADYYTVAPNGDQFYSVTTAYYTTDYQGELRSNPEEACRCEFISPHQLPEKMIGSHRKMIIEYVEKFSSEK
ncbi:NUDIX hydrolase [Halobacillus sp. Marseille-Q1614]|uniref:NUDIX hydrolase n=1 Tax=Halobacillus sp. Marseille-Q1614 TaxID=2709134 RepID=UPI00156FD0DE|nr:NUDIX hydrolase [Halobacillus sp. Marseille-Q1614]